MYKENFLHKASSYITHTVVYQYRIFLSEVLVLCIGETPESVKCKEDTLLRLKFCLSYLVVVNYASTTEHAQWNKDMEL